MADPIKTVQQSTLINRVVIDRDSLEEMGRIEVLWMYPPIHRVLGFVCKSGFLGNKKFAYRLAQIAEFRDDGVVVHSQPDATDAERVRLLESLLQYEVWRADGDTPDASPQERIGKINDCLFKLKNGKIIHYLFVSNGFSGILGDVYQLPPTKILKIDENRVLVAASIVPTLHLDREGIAQKLADVGDFVREEAAFEWRSITRRANRITAGTRERLQALTQQTQAFTQQTQERSQQFTQEAKEKVKILDERLQEFPQNWVDRLRSKSQTVADRIKQGTQDLSQRVEEGIGIVLEQTEDWFEEEAKTESGEGEEVKREEVKREEAGNQDKKEQGEENAWDEDEWDDVWSELTPGKKQIDPVDCAQTISESASSRSSEVSDDLITLTSRDDRLADGRSNDGLENGLENNTNEDLENDLNPNKNPNQSDHSNDDDEEPWI